LKVSMSTRTGCFHSTPPAFPAYNALSEGLVLIMKCVWRVAAMGMERKDLPEDTDALSSNARKLAGCYRGILYERVDISFGPLMEKVFVAFTKGRRQARVHAHKGAQTLAVTKRRYSVFRVCELSTLLCRVSLCGRAREWKRCCK